MTSATTGMVDCGTQSTGPAGHQRATPGRAWHAADQQSVTVAETPAPPSGAVDTGGGRAEAPFGVEVLGELPPFAAALEALVSADARMLEGLLALAELLDTDEVAHTTGVSVEQWLGIVARQTRMDRRLLLRLCRLLHRYPALAEGVRTARVSFAQLRGLGLVLRDAPTAIDEALDELLACLLEQLSGADPDVLVRQVRDAIVELSPARGVYDADPQVNRLWIQPNLARTGGRFGGDLNTLGLAILDDATAPRRNQSDHPGGIEGARAHNLLAHLTHDCPSGREHEPGGDPNGNGPGGDPSRDGPNGSGPGGDPSRDGPNGSGPGGDPSRDGPGDDRPGGDPSGDRPGGDPSGDRPGGDPSGDRPGGELGMDPLMACLPAPKLLLRMDLSTLLADSRLPVAVLTRLVGGQLKLSSQAARRLLDARGAQVRAIVVDQGKVVGIGRASRQPPGWLSDGVLAVHDTCTGPLCERPALGADLDHATPWWPDRLDAAYGSTDIDNLGPLCLSTNRTRQLTGWHAVQHPDGRRTWTHQRSGLSITSVPSTWRPAGWCPPDPHPPPPRRPPGRAGPADRTGHPGGTRPPGPTTRPDPALPSPSPSDDLPF
jgi:hypothetical protein